MIDLFDLTDRVALVTGASSGFGRHFSATLADAGAKVVATARRVPDIERVAADIEAAGGRAVAVPMDVTDAAQVSRAFEAAERAFGTVTIVVNNSGVASAAPALELTEAEWDRVLDTNLKGAWLVATEGARRMAAAGAPGSIVNIASIVGFRAAKGLAAYAASKAGLVHLTEALALELARHDIRVNAVAPGYFLTDMNRAFFDSEPGRAMIKRIPQRRLGEPRDLDGALLLLASDASRYMTGSVVTVDGGHVQSSL